METELKIFLALAAIFLSVVGGAMVKDSYTDNLIASMVRVGMNPQDARCAFMSDPSKNAVCVLRAQISRESGS